MRGLSPAAELAEPPASWSRRCAVQAAIALHRLFRRRVATPGMLRASQDRWAGDRRREKGIPGRRALRSSDGNGSRA